MDIQQQSNSQRELCCPICFERNHDSEGFVDLIFRETERANFMERIDYSLLQAIHDSGAADVLSEITLENAGDFISPFACPYSPHLFHRLCVAGHLFIKCLRTEGGRIDFNEVGCPSCRAILRPEFIALSDAQRLRGNSRFPFNGEAFNGAPETTNSEPYIEETHDSDSYLSRFNPPPYYSLSSSFVEQLWGYDYTVWPPREIDYRREPFTYFYAFDPPGFPTRKEHICF